MLKAKITALGCYAPPKLLTNDDLSKMVETSDSWIVERTGIRQRHIAEPDMATSDMAVLAAEAALASVGESATDLDAILVCTVTPDHLFPSTACLVQHRLGAKRAWGFDLVAACSGFLYGLTTAAHLVHSGTHRKVLVIGADTMSRILDYKDRTTCILFGDAAGAMLVEPAGPGDEGCCLGFRNQIDGSGGSFLHMPAGGSRLPASHQTVDQHQHFVKQDGGQVFKYAVRTMFEICSGLLDECGVKPDEISCLVPHQANQRIIAGVAERLGMTDRAVINIDEYGNTTGATIPLATRDALKQGRLKPGDLVLFAAVGAGYTAGAALWRWSLSDAPRMDAGGRG